MKTKLRVYLDTSVFSAYFDDRDTGRQSDTVEFWQRLEQFEVSTSELARQELRQASDPKLRRKFEEILRPMKTLPLKQEMYELADYYVGTEVFTPLMFNDALHVAAAVLSRQDVLLSWNFRHLVNRRRRSLINQLNTSRGLPTIEILAPPEL